MIYEADLTQLPKGGEDAFIIFEKDISQSYEKDMHSDRDYQGNQNMDGEYCGSYTPERSYVNSILAFVDEYNLGIDVPDISSLRGYEFLEKFEEFKSKIGYSVMRFSLRQHRIDRGTVGTVILISSTYKSEIGSQLEIIRKIVNQEVNDVKKKDKIFSKIASLQSEVDREQTTVDAVFGCMLDLSSTLGKCAENIEPLISKMERIKKLLWDKSKKVELLPSKKRQKLITKQDNISSDDAFDDNIPF